MYMLNCLQLSEREREREREMESLRGRGIVAAAVAVAALVAMLPDVAAVRYMVGGKKGWSSNVNYTVWAQDKHFYTEDWLFFLYDRNQMSVLEVNKTSYETCNLDHILHNYTTGAGRDVVPLNVSRNYYFISGNGFCFGGMKLAIHVDETPPPPSAPPSHNIGASTLNLRGKFVIPTLFAIASVWDSLLRLA